LTTFKTHLVVTTGTGLLALVATAGCFSKTRANAATHTAFVMFSAVSRLDAIEFHHLPLTAL
jgi:hypothetical protein